MGVSPSRREDKVEIVLKRADARLEEWFRGGQKATRKASARVTAFLHRAKRQSAGALRHEVDQLQAGLKKLSTRLDQVEHAATVAPKKHTIQIARVEHEVAPTPKKRRARPAPASKAVSSRKAASTRKRKKAA
ncbi:MAG: hypothetical protein QOJ33_2157 [Chloroflexota bacterium]|nr:hypothetical protein [Chloroflexota bacterium]